MTVVIRNQIEGSSAIRNPNGTFTLFETVSVEGLTSVGSSKFLEALEVANAQIGSPHPEVTNMELRNATVIPNSSPTVVEIRLEYQQTQFPIFNTNQQVENSSQVGATLSQEQTNTDVFGDLMTVSHFPLDENGNPGAVANVQTGTASILLPQVTVSISKKSQFNPLSIAKDFVGTINAGGWRLDNNAQQGTWLVTGVNGSTQDDGISWDVSYSFQFKRLGWFTKIVFRDESGQVPGDVGTGFNIDSIQEFRLYEFTNFDSFINV